MHFSPTADFSDSIAWIFDGMKLGIVVSLLTALVEGAGLRYLEWDDLRRCMIDSFVMNAASLVAGLLIIWDGVFFPFLLFAVVRLLDSLPGTLLFFVIGWILSVLIEGVMLSILRKRPLETIWRPILIVNTISYVGLVILFLIYFIVDPRFHY